MRERRPEPPDLWPPQRSVPVTLDPVGEPSGLERWGGGCLSTLGAWIITAVVFVGVLDWDGAGAMWFALLVALGVIWLARKFEDTERRGRRRIRKWRKTARRAGWADMEGDRRQRRLRSPGGVELTLMADGQAQAVLALRPTLAAGQVSPEVSLSRDLREGPPSGDPWLDERVTVEGDPAVWRSLWDAHDRKRLGELAEGLGLKIVDQGHLEVALIHLSKQGGQRRLAHLTEWAQLAQTLAYTPAELPDALLRRITAEPDRVGLLAYHSLREGWPDAPQVAQAEATLRAAAQRGGPLGVSLGALLEDPALIERGLPTHPPEAQRWGLRRLAQLWPASEVDERLVALLDQRHLGLRGSALRVLGERQIRLPTPQLVALASQPSVVGDLLAYLREVALPDIEPVWIALLDADHSEALRAAVDALANLGTRAAVAPLMAVDAGWRFQRHVDRALEAVRARLPATAQAGHLAVVAGDAGGLAVAPAEGEDEPE